MVDRIEKIVDGTVTHQAKAYPHGGEKKYQCFEEGQTMYPHRFHTLDEVASYLIQNRRSRVRMHPGRAITADHIHIEGVPLEELQAVGSNT